MLRAFTVSKPVSLVISMTVFNIISLVIFALGGIFFTSPISTITCTLCAQVTVINHIMQHMLCNNCYTLVLFCQEGISAAEKQAACATLFQVGTGGLLFSLYLLLLFLRTL